ncbi:uncharacterized protein [Arachis hypogaea]|uniref:uncharacterized protein n=1 Tax=Arachis hypogaea TaxID=3818 RepID=UPI003B21529B
MNAALQQKIEELQRNLMQVTNEKVKALVKFAQLKQEHQLLIEMKIEISTLKESMESLECLTSSIHRLRLSLFKTKKSVTCEDVVSSISEVLNEIINEAKFVKTALGSSLPISWSGEGDTGYTGDNASTGTTHQECTKGLG